jgi:hypothetical protein
MHWLFILATFAVAALTPYLGSAPNADQEWAQMLSDDGDEAENSEREI